MKKFYAVIIALTAVFGITTFAAEAAQITEAQAKEIALKHAGVSAQQAYFTKMKLDRDLVRAEYELEFYVGNVEYDYEIDAADGTVRKFSRETHSHAPFTQGPPPQAQGQPGQQGQIPSAPQLIGEQKAIEIALARVPGAQRRHVRKLKLDYEHGMQIYEGEIFYNFREYEFEINAHTGEVVGWEID